MLYHWNDGHVKGNNNHILKILKYCLLLTGMISPSLAFIQFHQPAGNIHRTFSNTFANNVLNDKLNNPESKRLPFLVNSEIVADQVRVTGVDLRGVVMPLEEALSRAEQAGLDLVMINEKEVPPVVKITDAKKLFYDIQLKKKHAIKKSNNKDMKELKLSHKMGVHDYQVTSIIHCSLFVVVLKMHNAIGEDSIGDQIYSSWSLG
jgi:hypothetical protein